MNRIPKKISYETGFRCLLMILIMGTNSAPFLMKKVGIYNSNSELDQPKKILENTDLTDIPIVLLYYSGYSAVYLFYFLSGFQSNQSLKRGLPYFLESRYKKIYLPSLFLMVIYFPFWAFGSGQNIFSGENYFLEFLLMGFDISGGHVNSPTWFLSPLFASYAVAPILNKFHAKLMESVYTSAIIFVYAAIIIICWLLGPRYELFYPLHIMLFFGLGMLAEQKRKQPKVGKFAIEQRRFRHVMELTLIFLAISLACLFVIYFQLSITSFSHIITFLLIFVFLLRNDVVINGKHRFLETVSDNSLYIMLVHYPIIQLYQISGFVVPIPSSELIVLYMVICILCASLAHKVADATIKIIV